MRPKLATDMRNGYRPQKCQNANFLQIFLSAVHFLSFHPAEVTHTRYGLYIAKIIICLLQTRRGIIIVPVIFYSNAGVCYSSSIVWTFFTWQIKKKNASMSVAPAGLKIHTRFSHGLEAGQKYYPDFLHERCERWGRSKQRNQRRGNTCIIYSDMHEPLKMWLKCVIKANLNPRQCWPVVSPRVLVWPGVLCTVCRGPTWLTAWPCMSSDLRFVIPVG